MDLSEGDTAFQPGLTMKIEGLPEAECWGMKRTKVTLNVDKRTPNLITPSVPAPHGFAVGPGGSEKTSKDGGLC